MPKSTESAEDRLIARYFRPLATAPGAFGLIDDAAALTPPPGCDLVLTTDGVIAGVHFFPDDPPAMVGRKALRMNLSDLAAKGARPLGFLLSVALPEGFGEAWLGAFAAALADDAAHYGCPLYGGDTDHTPGPISVSIFAFGAVPQGKMVRRSTARPGDRIVVTGTIGDAAIGLQLRRERTLARRWGLSEAAAAQLENRYLLPQPRNALAGAVLQYASAAIDVSDGLVGDLGKLCRASSVAADIDVATVPLSDAARAAIAAEPALLETALTGGDDYEIVLTLAPEKLDGFRTAAAAAGVAVTEIGGVQAGEGTRFLHEGKALTFTRASYSHF
ncbi:MAG TPA: thiamine-phosphate kinase [Xanthobacteraceae bacterium]|jgi:thiamine-monophosphate kinase|nr:thiamine-phosphate kinase [Xanthobacteraceae bacterium]